MPRNTTGGNKNKKKANKHVNEFINRKLEIPEGQEQEIGICTKILGSSRFSIKYVDTNENTLVETIGVARKNLKRSRQFVGVDKFVIISTRDYDNKVVDIIHVYNDTEVNTLKSKKLINEHLYNNEEKDDNFDFCDDMDLSNSENEEEDNN